MKWSLGSKVMVGYVLAVLVVPVMGLAIYRSTTRYMQLADQRKQARETIVRLDALLALLKSAESGQRGYLLTGREEYLTPFRHAEQEYATSVDKIRQAMSHKPGYKTRLDLLEKACREELNALKDGLATRVEAAPAGEKSRPQTPTSPALHDMAEIVREVSDLQQEHREEVDSRATEAAAQAEVTKWTIIAGNALAFLLLGVAGVLIRSRISGPLNAAIRVLSASATSIATATRQIATNATETATAVSETTATMAEVKQTALASVQKAQHVSASAQQTAQASQSGAASVDDMLTSINRIQEQTDSVAASIMRLSEQSQAIGGIISTVDDLAAQSNLLAVNAAIEAAKAGEQGKGFAVVAHEVRSLAEQSKQATAQVRTILNDIQKATAASVMATEQNSKAVAASLQQASVAGHAVRTLSESIQESAQAALQITASSQQQLAGMDQLAEAMISIKQASLHNAESTKQAESAAQDLMALGERLRNVVAGAGQLPANVTTALS